MKTSNLFFIIIILAVIIMVSLLFRNAETERYQFPPLVYIDTQLYKSEKAISKTEFNDDYIYIGNIETSVPSYESPKQNFQTNRSFLVGAEVYQLATNLVILYDSTYQLYSLIE